MTNIDIIRMAREVGFHRPVPADGYMGLAYDRREGRETGGSLERFAALVAAAAKAEEREACAKVCDKYSKANMESDIMSSAFDHCANTIRARTNVERGETK